jgi:ubiquinone/menaquinone biosynthesis C-methylase UbiE
MYAIKDGIVDLVYPNQLPPSDEEARTKYDAGASQYDVGLDWLFASFRLNENEVRGRMCDLLGVKGGDRVLEVGCGTGKDSAHLAARVGTGGHLVLSELSGGMLRLARQRLSGRAVPMDYVLANGCYLPFADGAFDCVFHFGGLNTFDNIGRALAEMARVVRPGGTVLVGDESVAPWLRNKLFGRILTTANPLYKYRPPLARLPATAQAVSVHWILGNAFYLIRFTAGDGPPPLDLDLPIPGKRGGTLRSRYFGSP